MCVCVRGEGSDGKVETTSSLALRARRGYKETTMPPINSLIYKMPLLRACRGFSAFFGGGGSCIGIYLLHRAVLENTNVEGCIN